MKRLSIILILIVALIILSPYITAQGEWTVKLAYDGSDRLQYIGTAVPGTATSASLWQIERLTYDGVSTRIADRTYANGDQTHKFIWDNRATYAYSY